MEPSKNKSDLRVLGWPAFKFKALNPYNWLLYTAIQKLNTQVIEFSIWQLLFGHYDILHIHWPEGYLGRKHTLEALLKTLVVFLFLGIARLRGAKIVWTAHNLTPHNEDHPTLVRYFWTFFPYFLDGFICLSESSHKLVLDTYPTLKKIRHFSHVFGIGHYGDIYPDEIKREQARQTLDFPKNAFVFLFIGHIIPYKNVPALARSFQGVHGNDNILLIAGKPSSESLTSELQDLAAQDHRIHLYLDFVPDEKLQIFLNAADLVIFPFQNILNSSSAMMALAFNKPVLVPHSGSLVDLQKLIGCYWIQTYQDIFSSVELMKAKNSILFSRPVNIDFSAFNWEKIAHETFEFYKNIMQL